MTYFVFIPHTVCRFIYCGMLKIVCECISFRCLACAAKIIPGYSSLFVTTIALNRAALNTRGPGLAAGFGQRSRGQAGRYRDVQRRVIQFYRLSYRAQAPTNIRRPPRVCTLFIGPDPCVSFIVSFSLYPAFLSLLFKINNDCWEK